MNQLCMNAFKLREPLLCIGCSIRILSNDKVKAEYAQEIRLMLRSVEKLSRRELNRKLCINILLVKI